MNMSNHRFIGIAVAAELFAAQAAVQAAPISVEAETPASLAPETFSLQTETAAAVVPQTRAAASTFGSAPGASSAANTDRRALAVQSLDGAESQAALSLTLWSFARAIQAQQEGSPFEMLQTSLALQEFQIAPLAGEITAVPLPGAVWLFVMGLLGLAGSRMTRVGGEGLAGAGREESRPFGGAVPA